MNDVGYALYLKSSVDRAGEDWTAVIQNGHGLYAHVQEIGDANGNDTNLVNIEYSILWAYNNGFCSQHHGDITSIVVVYDRAADRVTRISYSIHGSTLLMFRTALPGTFTTSTLSGADASGTATTIPVVALDVSGDDQVQRGDYLTAGDARVYFASDPSTGLFEHPVVFAENNSHELWPNASGKITEAASHAGDGVSFLPSKVQVLGTLEQPVAAHAAFLYFNGKFGTDPQPIALHRTWLWRDWTQRGVAGTIRIPESRFTDKDPYCRAGDSECAAPDRLRWPPAAEFVDVSPRLFVGPGSNLIARFDAPSAPFHDVYSALSFAPCGGQIVLSSGSYSAPIALSRACGGLESAHGIVLSAAGGSVTLRKN